MDVENGYSSPAKKEPSQVAQISSSLVKQEVEDAAPGNVVVLPPMHLMQGLIAQSKMLLQHEEMHHPQHEYIGDPSYPFPPSAVAVPTFHSVRLAK